MVRLHDHPHILKVFSGTYMDDYLNTIADAWKASILEKYSEEVRKSISTSTSEEDFWFYMCGLGKTMHDWDGQHDDETYQRLHAKAVENLRSICVSEALIAEANRLGSLLIEGKRGKYRTHKEK